MLPPPILIATVTKNMGNRQRSESESVQGSACSSHRWSNQRMVKVLYRVIKKSLCTCFLYCNHQVHKNFWSLCITRNSVPRLIFSKKTMKYTQRCSCARVYEVVEAQIHAFLTSALDVSSRLHAPDALESTVPTEYEAGVVSEPNWTLTRTEKISYSSDP